MTRKIKNTGGNWTATNEKLIKTTKILVKFVKSLELTDLKLLSIKT